MLIVVISSSINHIFFSKKMSTLAKPCETNASVSFTNETNDCSHGEKIQLDEPAIQNATHCPNLCVERENNKSCDCPQQEVNKDSRNDFWIENPLIIIISDDETVRVFLFSIEI